MRKVSLFLKLLTSEFFLVIVFAVFLSFLLSWPVYMLWNGCLVGAIDGVREITWLQGWGLNILCGALFKPAATLDLKQ